VAAGATVNRPSPEADGGYGALHSGAGAREVHMRIASPPYTHPCHYGIDTSRATELAARNMTVEAIRAMVGADSLAYLSLEGLKAALGGHPWCLACFGAGYPVALAEPADGE